MAKSRAQRKAEQRRRQALGQDGSEQAAESQAQHDTQVPESADVIEAELAEKGANLDELAAETPAEADAKARAADTEAPPGTPGGEAEDVAGVVPDRISRRAQRAAEKERRAAAKESERRRAPREEVVEKQRGAITGFIASCIAELKRVQWPDRETLIQASAITVVFIAIMAAYLGVLDAVFNFLVQRIL